MNRFSVSGSLLLFVSWVALVLTGAVFGDDVGHGGNVTYDGRSLIINGERKILFSGSIHYPRSTPQMWPSLISKAKAGGLDVIQTYVFWNLHEPQYRQYDFSGRNDIVSFIKQIQSQGLYASIRIGPFIESEWSYGGLPFWLHDIKGIVYRSDNKQFKNEMQNFTTKIVNMLKSEGLYASQGGPIILSQIENEYQNVEAAFHGKGPPYVRWAAEMAVGLQTGVPWVMCKQNDAPDPVINACNGMRCGETFEGPNSPNKPSIWTENWTSFIQTYGNEPYIRKPEDIAFHVALFLAKNGSYVNYYMYHGGTNFGRTASAYIITGYYDQAPLDEYGLTRQPKYGHLKELHAAVKLCSKALLSGSRTIVTLGQLQTAYVFQEDSGTCAAFLVNNDDRKNVGVVFRNNSFRLPRKSISILPDCKTIAFNTAKVNVQYNKRLMQITQKLDSPSQWQAYTEPVPSFDDTTLKANALLEQMGTTKDTSDYLWYSFKYNHVSSNDSKTVLEVMSHGHLVYAYVNGKFIGSAHGSSRTKNVTLQQAIPLIKGTNNISLLSTMVGLPDSGAYLEKRFAGLRWVRLAGDHGVKDFTKASWGYQVALSGEKQQIYDGSNSSAVQWSPYGNSSTQPLTWYKTIFDAPGGTDPIALNQWRIQDFRLGRGTCPLCPSSASTIALNLGSMGKGQAWVNGQNIGRYWVSFHTPKGNPSQTWYHVPRSFLKPTGNLLVLLDEETGTNPIGISIDTVSVSEVCGYVSDMHPPAVMSWKEGVTTNVTQPKVQLRCPSETSISKILFASFGNPSGGCNSYGIGSCHASSSKSIVEKACLGRRSCAVPNSSEFFGGNPCPGKDQALLVAAECG